MSETTMERTWAIGFADREYDRVMTNGAPLGYVRAASKEEAERTAQAQGMGRGHLAGLWAWLVTKEVTP